MVTRAALPSLVIPERRPNEVDGIAIGKELTGLIRGAKTRSAINKALRGGRNTREKTTHEVRISK